MGSFRTLTLLAVAATTSLMLFGCGAGEAPTPAPTTASERFESRVTNLKEKNIDALTRDYQDFWHYDIETQKLNLNQLFGFHGRETNDLRSVYLDPFVKCYTGGSSSQPDVLVSKFHEGKGVGVLVFKSPCAVMSVETLVFNDAGIDMHFGYVAQPEPTAGLLGMGQDRVSTLDDADPVMTKKISSDSVTDPSKTCPDIMTKKIIEAWSSDNVTEMYSDDALLMFVDMRKASREVKTYAGKADIGNFFVAESSWLELETTIVSGTTLGRKQFECVDYAISMGTYGARMWGASFHTDGLVLFQTIVAFNFTAPGTLEDLFVF